MEQEATQKKFDGTSEKEHVRLTLFATFHCWGDDGEDEMCSGEKASVALQDGGGNGLGVFQGGYVYECLSKKPPRSPK